MYQGGGNDDGGYMAKMAAMLDMNKCLKSFFSGTKWPKW